MKLKNLRTKIAVLFVASALFLGVGISPIFVSAEEPTETTETTTEIAGSTDDTQAPEEIPADEETDEISPETNPETGTETETETEIEPDEQKKEDHSFEEFLAWTEQEAERYGYGEQYKAAIEAIKTAATQKQVTLSTFMTLGLALAIIGYILYKKISDRKFRKAVAGLVGDIHVQAGKINELVKGTNDNSKTERELKEELAQSIANLNKLTKGLASFVTGFLRFTDGVKLQDNKKTEVQTNCLNALKEMNGEVGADENNKE